MRVMAIDTMVLPNQYDFGNCLTLLCSSFLFLVLNTELLLQAAVFQCATLYSELGEKGRGKKLFVITLMVFGAALFLVLLCELGSGPSLETQMSDLVVLRLGKGEDAHNLLICNILHTFYHLNKYRAMGH